MPQTPAPRNLKLLLLLPAALLTACATTSIPLVPTCPALPAPPPVTTPQPSKPYLESAQEKLNDWRDRLKATPLTP